MGKTNGKSNGVALLDVSTRQEALQALADAGIKQKHIAAALKVGASTVSRWYSEERSPSKENIRGLFDKFGVPKVVWI